MIEAEAVLGIIDRIESGEVDLLGSEILQLETEDNPNSVGRRFALDVLGLASRQVKVDGEIESAARAYETSGIQPYDALHLASAVEGGADVFCTTDDDLYHAGQTVNTEDTDVLTPVELIEVIES
ncbi:MAG: type II toxin-antitoxin system VapC family toxin [Salinibacter sp.]